MQQQHSSKKRLPLAVTDVFVVDGVGLEERWRERSLVSIHILSLGASSHWAAACSCLQAVHILVLQLECVGHEHMGSPKEAASFLKQFWMPHHPQVHLQNL